MWSSVLIMALLTELDPVRLGIILLMTSRRRPVQNMFVYWIGCLIVAVPSLLVPLMLLHITPGFKNYVQDFANPASAASSAMRHFQVGTGVVMLAVTALMILRFSTRQRGTTGRHRARPAPRRRAQAQLPIRSGNTSTLEAESDTPTAISRLLDRAREAAMEPEGGSLGRRLLGRAYNAWVDGSLWVSLVFGLASGPPPLPVVFVLTTLMASGAAIGTQVSAALVFIIGMLLIVEILLVSYRTAPDKTQAALQRLYDWVWVHRRKVAVTIFGVVGVSMVAQGMGGM